MSKESVPASRLPWDRCFQFAIPAFGAAIAAFSGAPRFQGSGVSITWASTLLYGTSALFLVVAVWLTYLAVTRHPAFQLWSRRAGALVIAVLSGFFVFAATISLPATWIPGLAPMTRGFLWGVVSTLILVGILLGCAVWLYLRRVAPAAALAPKEASAASSPWITLGTGEPNKEEDSPSPADDEKRLPFNPFTGGWRPYIPTWEDEAYREGQQQKYALRKERGLKPLSDFQEGLPASAVDPGTYAVLAGNLLYPDVLSLLGRPSNTGMNPDHIRLRGSRDDESGGDFEVHCLRGAVEIVGFASKQDTHVIRSARKESRVSIFSRKTADAPELVTVDVSRILSAETHTVRRSASRIDARLKPAT